MSVRKRIPPYWLTQPGSHAWHVEGLTDLLHISMANLLLAPASCEGYLMGVAAATKCEYVCRWPLIAPKQYSALWITKIVPIESKRKHLSWLRLNLYERQLWSKPPRRWITQPSETNSGGPGLSNKRQSMLCRRHRAPLLLLKYIGLSYQKPLRH